MTSVFSLTALLSGAVACAPGHVFDLNVSLNLEEDVSHLGNLVFHQVLLEKGSDLQPTDERCLRNIFIVII